MIKNNFTINKMNILDENDLYIEQPNNIKKILLPHQKTIIKKMLDIEENCLIDLKNNDILLKTSFAILGDKVGAGKTLCIITLISMRRLLEEKMSILYAENHYSIVYKSLLNKIQSNLLIVPQKLILQWEESFITNSSLKILKIYNIKQLKNILVQTEKFDLSNAQIDVNIINNYDVILIGDTSLKNFIKIFNNLKWNRVFIDEIDTIKISR